MYTNKQIKAIRKIIRNAGSFNPMLAGEIPTNQGVVLTDGIIVVRNHSSFGEDVCASDTRERIGREINEKLDIMTAEAKSLVEHPFRMKKVIKKLRALCKEYVVTDRYGHSFINIEGSVFDTDKLFTAFDAVGSKACGFFASAPYLLEGEKYMIIEPENADYEKDVHAVLLPVIKGR